MANHRVALILAGTADWTWACAEVALGGLDAVWLTERSTMGAALPLEAAERLLGQGVDHLVYDAHGGLDPDGFGAACGAIRGGGLLLLLTPPLDIWSSWPDPFAQRIAVHPYPSDAVGRRFLVRFAHVLRTSPGCWILEQGAPLPQIPSAAAGTTAAPGPIGDRSPGVAATQDQQRAIEAVVKTAHGRARRPLVIRADRGRGKTAALGLAAARLLQTDARSILVTAPRRAAVEPLFRHAAAALTETRRDARGIFYPEARLRFIAPDALDRCAPDGSLLIIDEAAGIPAPLLERALLRHPRIIFATTVHGYEGTGRGFDVRFRDTLDRLTPSWRAIDLVTPIRWAVDDPLEALTSRVLLLDATPTPAERIRTAHPATCLWSRLDRDRLVTDEPTLTALFGLLVLAHYQTRPRDLRHLLDGPNVRIEVLRHTGKIVATLLAADEGAFDEALSAAVFAGRRRPRGHLLAQTLAAHAGLADAPRLRYRRIMRLAVHPAAQRRGLGRQLLAATVVAAQDDDVDLVGASFGATTALLRFWMGCGFAPVHIGTHRNAASGEYALVVLRALTGRGEAFLEAARRRLAERLPKWLPGPLGEASPTLIAALFGALPGGTPRLDRDAWQELETFARERRCLEAVLPLLVELAAARAGQAIRDERLDGDSAATLVAVALQMHEPSEVAARFGCRGRADLIDRLRRATAVLLGT